MTILRKCILQARCLLPLLSLLLLPPASARGDSLIAEISLNDQNLGAFFLETSEKGAFLIRADDYPALGLLGPVPPAVVYHDVSYIPLAAIAATPPQLDETTLTLKLQVDPQRLPPRNIDLTPHLARNIIYPSDTSLLFNYALTYAHEGLSDTDSLQLPHEMALRYRDFLLLYNALYTDNNDENNYIRLMSTVYRDDRKNLNRTQFGDLLSSSGRLGSRLNLGGIRYSRDFDIDPYFVEYPTATYSGELATPSEVRVLLDGVEIYSEHLPPGPFHLDNIFHQRGAGNLEIYVTDAFGNEKRIDEPFYIEESLLKRNAHSFAYSAGALRENFGTESNDYGDAVFQAEHRYGLRDNVTIGAALEGSADLLNARALASSLVGPYGVIDFEAGGSSGYNTSGAALSLEYSFLTRHFNARALLQYFGEGYRRLSDSEDPDDLLASVSGISFGFVDRRFGSISLDYLDKTKHLGEDQAIYSASYNRRLMRGLNMSCTFRHTEQDKAEDLLFLSLHYAPWGETQLSSFLEVADNGNEEMLQLQKSPPSGEGYGYEVSLERHSDDNREDITLNPSGEWNARYGFLKADVANVSGDNNYTSYQFTAGGALVAIGSRWGFTRPVHDSFALVTVGSLDGIPVRLNAQTSGQTNADGYLFAPEINSFYTNQVSIDDQAIPLNYALAYNQQLISPPYRSGSCVYFPATRLQPVIGHLKVNHGGHLVPLEFSLQHVRFAQRLYPLHTGKDGEFYLDPSEFDAPRAAAGCPDREPQATASLGEKVMLQIDYAGKTYELALDIPQSDDLFIDAGEVVLQVDE